MKLLILMCYIIWFDQSRPTFSQISSYFGGYLEGSEILKKT